jgi:hypothetical protein
MSDDATYLDGNAAAGALSDIFTIDITSAVGRCENCGAVKPFAQAMVFTDAPGLVARCPACESVLLRLVTTGERIYLDMRGIAYLTAEVPESAPGGR